MARPTTIAAVAVAVAVLILAILVFALTRTAHSPASSPSPSPSPATTASSPASPLASASPAAKTQPTIAYDGNMFIPNQTTVKAGETITFINKSSKVVDPNSDNHPAHTDNSELNVGKLEPGQSKTVTATKKGSFGLHNHLNPAQTTRVTVQ